MKALQNEVYFWLQPKPTTNQVENVSVLVDLTEEKTCKKKKKHLNHTKNGLCFVKYLS